MPDIPTRLANRLIKSDVKYRTTECLEPIKAPVIFDLIINYDERLHVIDGKKLYNGDWELFVMNSDDELHDIRLYHESEDMIIAYPNVNYVNK